MVGGRVKLDLFVLEYDAFEIHWRFCSAVFVVVLCFVFFVIVVVSHLGPAVNRQLAYPRGDS